MDTTDFDHLDANKKVVFTQKFKDMHFLHTCTRIDCKEYGTVARIDEQRNYM